MTERLASRHSLITQGLRTYMDAKFEGQKVRSRAKWFESGEKSSKYFHALVAARRLASSISSVQRENGQMVSSTEEMIAEACLFYQKLYRAGSVDISSQDTLLDCVSSSLTAEQVQLLEAPFSTKEVLMAISHSSSHSSPGRDGLPFSFYKTFAGVLVGPLVELYNQVWLKARFNHLLCLVLFP